MSRTLVKHALKLDKIKWKLFMPAIQKTEKKDIHEISCYSRSYVGVMSCKPVFFHTAKMPILFRHYKQLINTWIKGQPTGNIQLNTIGDFN